MNLTVENSIGEQFNVIVVRYFTYNGGKYLIFTKNETDETGYQKLYITKIQNMVGNNIDDDIEWNLVRDVIKVIAKANKDHTTLPVQDLNEAEINGIQILNQKPFKLTASSVALLSANRNVEPAIVQPQMAPVNPIEGMPQPEATVSQNVQESSFVQQVPQQVQVPISPEPQINPLPNSTATFEPNILQNDDLNNVSVQGENLNNAMPVQSNALPVDNVAPSIDNIVPPGIQPSNNVIQPIAPDPFNFTMQTPSGQVATPTMPVEPVIAQDAVDYKKLYEEQTLKLNALTVELDKYKALFEQLKSILK